MARVSTGKGYHKEYKKRLFRNNVFVRLRDTSYRYAQEQRARLEMPLSMFIDYAINELMKKKPPQISKREYLNSFFVDSDESKERNRD